MKLPPCFFFLSGLTLLILTALLLLSPRPPLSLMMVSETGTLDIHAVHLPSEDHLTIAEGDHAYRFFDWSPDGQWILFSETDQQTQHLARKRLNGHRALSLENLADSTYFYGWSPSQTWLVFYAFPPSLDRIFYRVRPDGTDLTRLSLLPNLNHVLAWSANEEWVIFSTLNRGIEAFYRVDLATNRADYLVGNLKAGSFKALSPNNEWVIYTAYTETTHKLYRLNVQNRLKLPALGDSQFDHFHTVHHENVYFSSDDGWLYQLHMDSGEVTPLADISACGLLNFQAAMDEKLLFWCGYETLMILEDGRLTALLELTDNATLFSFAGWQGNFVWFSAYQYEVRSLFVLEMEKRTFQRLTPRSKSEGFIAWIPNQETGIVTEFLAASQNNRVFSMYQISADGNDQTLLTHEPYYFYGWSPTLDKNFHAAWTLPPVIAIMLAGSVLQRRRHD